MFSLFSYLLFDLCMCFFEWADQRPKHFDIRCPPQLALDRSMDTKLRINCNDSKCRTLASSASCKYLLNYFTPGVGHVIHIALDTIARLFVSFFVVAKSTRARDKTISQMILQFLAACCCCCWCWGHVYALHILHILRSFRNGMNWARLERCDANQ